MIRRLAPVISLSLLTCAAIGWVRAGTIAGAQGPLVDNWDAAQYDPVSKDEYRKISERLKASSLLPVSLIEERTNSTSPSQSVQTAEKAPDFPKIGGAKTVNKTRFVSLVDKDNVIRTVKAGDVLESGWEIKSITRTTVSAVFDGEEISVPINSYLQEAFEKPEEEVKDSDSAGDQGSKLNKAAQKAPGSGE